MEATEQLKIKSFDDLIRFIENHDLTDNDINSIISSTMGVIVIHDYNTKAELIERLKVYWGKWKNNIEHPLFLDVDLDVEN